jgi:hypothetical protein
VACSEGGGDHDKSSFGLPGGEASAASAARAGDAFSGGEYIGLLAVNGRESGLEAELENDGPYIGRGVGLVSGPLRDEGGMGGAAGLDTRGIGRASTLPAAFAEGIVGK